MSDPQTRSRDPWPDVPPERRRIMAANRRRDTGPELRLRSSLHRDGLRFRVDYPIPVHGRRPIRPDVVFTRTQVAVFLDGCFWHGCPEHGSAPAANASYWAPKIARTRERDREADRLLSEAGWTVVRVWEHVPLGEATRLVHEALRSPASAS
jgi:DNA mismatch endonuclease (patch repair protein)